MLEPGKILQNRYQIIAPIGKGGMGSVYRARDLRLRTDVALKETLFSDPVYRRAFQQEAQILARLRHQALPRVLDHFSEGQGRFLVMEYIPGEDLGNQLARLGARFATPQAMPTILRWADQLLDALHYLHTRPVPVYHRDIKPKNLKLTATYEIILLDFGLARGGVTVSFDLNDTTASQAQAQARKIYGFTPPYAPLEQMRDGEPDARSDLYSLAATIYHLLTATMPVDAMARMAKLAHGQPDPLRPIRDLAPHVPEGIAELLQQALHVTIDERPKTAREMREALQRLRGSPSPTRAGSTGQPASQPPPRAGAVTNATPASEPRPPVEGLSTSATSYPGAITPHVAGPSTELTAKPIGALLRMLTTGSPIRSLDFSPGGALLAAGYDDHTAGLWRIADFTHLATLKGHTSGIRCLRFAPTGGILATASDDETVRLWQVADSAFLRLVRVPGCPIESIAFSPNGRHLAIGGWGSAITLCEVEKDRLRIVNSLASPFIHSLAFSPDNSLIAAGAYDGSVYLWQARDARLVGVLSGSTTFINSVAFSPDGAWLVAGSGNQARVWRLHDQKAIESLGGHQGPVHAIAFSPDGHFLATASEDRMIRLWRTSDWTALPTTLEHRAGVASLAYAPHGSIIASGARDGRIYLWRIAGA
ncbi:MAG: WD40 repeat domain-containing serine/threonine protein kinase [Chloroflexaceae bacterium]